MKNKTKKFNEERYTWSVDLNSLNPAHRIRIGRCVELVGVGKKVLDVGCFEGTISKLFLKRGNEVYGLDISPAAVKKARKKGIKAQTGDVEEAWPFEDDTFDLVFAGEIIEHVFDTDGFLQEAKRVLKPHGELVLTTPNLASLGRRLLLFGGQNPHIETGMSHKDDDAGHVRYFVKGSLSKLLTRNGFKITRFTSNVVNFTPSGRLSSKFLARIFPTLGSALIVKCRVKK